MNAGGESERPTRSFDSMSEDDTLRLGRSVGSALRGGDVMFVEGPLGAGKTCLIRGICAGLGFAGRVRSPSFAVVNRYDGSPRIFHMDLYRIPESSVELEDLSRQEYFSADAVTLIEWGEKLRRWGVAPSALALIAVTEGERRRIELAVEDKETALRLRAIEDRP